MSDVDTLRKAAALMRERARAARAGRWFADRNMVRARWASGPRDVLICDASLPEGNRANAAHVAGMDPAVALAVADLLDAVRENKFRPEMIGEGDDGCSECWDYLLLREHVRFADALARAYLGGE